ncbi:MAG: hypothetical protein ABFD82_08160 [Syntrophaceae bacterium]
MLPIRWAACSIREEPPVCCASFGAVPTPCLIWDLAERDHLRLTVAPGGQGADEQEDHDDAQDDSHAIFLFQP